MRSSYKENNYGSVLSALIIGKKPELCVELGVLDGYSAIHIASALKFNQKTFEIEGNLYCWDLWDEYKYNHGSQEEVQKEIDEHKLTSIVNLEKGDGFEVSAKIPEMSVDFLHVDISNDGNTLKKVIEIWGPKITSFGIIVFEGGSEERDNVEWMIKYNKKPITEELKNNKKIIDGYDYFVMNPFPSMTILQKKSWFAS